MARATGSSLTSDGRCWERAAVSLGRFALLTFGLALALSLPLSLATEWPWWRVFRRCVSIAAAVSLWLCLRVVEKRSLRSYGFSSGREGKRQLCFGLSLGVAALALMLGLGLLTGACALDVTTDSWKLWRTVLGFLPAALLVSVLEELVFRGVVLQPLLACSRWFGVVASSACYAVVHLKAAPAGLLAWMELGGLFLLGGVLAVSYLVTNQLYLAVGLHAALAYGARVNKVLISFTDAFPGWLVGTSRLVNGLVSWAVLLLIGVIVVWWVRSSRTGGKTA